MKRRIFGIAAAITIYLSLSAISVYFQIEEISKKPQSFTLISRFQPNVPTETQVSRAVYYNNLAILTWYEKHLSYPVISSADFFSLEKNPYVNEFLSASNIYVCDFWSPYVRSATHEEVRNLLANPITLDFNWIFVRPDSTGVTKQQYSSMPNTASNPLEVVTVVCPQLSSIRLHPNVERVKLNSRFNYNAFMIASFSIASDSTK